MPRFGNAIGQLSLGDLDEYFRNHGTSEDAWLKEPAYAPKVTPAPQTDTQK